MTAEHHLLLLLYHTPSANYVTVCHVVWVRIIYKLYKQSIIFLLEFYLTKQQESFIILVKHFCG